MVVTIDVGQMPYEDLLEQWEPKIHKMGYWFIPYLDVEDVRQELRIVLWRCQLKYQVGSTKASFHTYLHRAMLNRLGNLTAMVKRHNPDWGGLLYLSKLLEEGEAYSSAHRQLGYVLEDSPVLYLELEGFTPLEIGWTLGRADYLKVREIAEVAGVTEREVRAAAKTAKKKLNALRRRIVCA